jgi:thiol-disulfide isomerase/thioredoxin
MKKFTYLLAFLFLVKIAAAQVPIDTAINFSVKDIDGTKIELFSILDEGKLVVIDFFSTSCGPCGIYAPEVQASYEDFGENNGNVFFMSICWGDDNAGVAYFDSIHGLTHPSVSGSQGGGNVVHNDYQVISTPTVILINPEREIVEQYIWEPTQTNLNAAITAHGGSMVGIEDDIVKFEDNLLIYPNPGHGLVNIKAEVSGSALLHIEVYNLLGIKVHQSDPVSFTTGSHIIQSDLSGLPEGTYFVRLLKNGQHQNLSRLILLN